MKNLLLFGFLLVSPILSAQETSLLQNFCRNVSESCVELTYGYSVRLSGIDNVGSGTLTAQGALWKLYGNGVEMYCDSSSIWVLDPDRKEAVIEPAVSDSETFFQTNPAIFLLRLENLFDVSESRPTSDNLAMLYILRPKNKGEIDYFNVEILRSDASVRRCTFALSDGTLIKIEVSSMKLTPVRPLADFRPQTVFDSSWIVTDMR